MNLRDPDLYALAEHLWLLAGADDTDRHFSEQMWGGRAVCASVTLYYVTCFML